MFRFLPALLLGAALTFSTAVTPLRAADRDARVYHDTKANDDHHWDSHEDKAYRSWEKENHRKHVDFAKQKPEEQENYWGWRHQHSDAQLKINIR